MTAQTSDTDITSNAMRRLVLVHGVFSFFFNTVIVAAGGQYRGGAGALTTADAHEIGPKIS